MTVMKSLILLVIILSSGIGPGCTQQPSFQNRAGELGLEYVADIPLSGGNTRFDYQSIDERKRRLYIAHLGADMVTVVDIDARQVVKNITDIPRPHGILAVPQLNRVYISATGDDEIYVIDDQSLKVVSKIPAGRYPDGIAFDPDTKRLFVSDEYGKTVAVVDATGEHLLSKIEIGGEVGNTHYDPVTRLIYSADQTNNDLVAIDPQTLTITDRYHLPGCKGAHGFYIVTEFDYAFVTGEDNGAYAVLDLSRKEIIASGEAGKGPDVLAYDEESRRLYVSSESGTVSVFHIEKGKIEKVAETFFSRDAHTVSVDQMSHQVFFPLPDIGGHPVLRVMKAGK